jgi:hypothetical protein
LIDDAKAALVSAQEGFFKLELRKDGLVLEMDEMNFRANR